MTENLHRLVEVADEAGRAEDLLVDGDRRRCSLGLAGARHVAGLQDAHLDEVRDPADVHDLVLDLEWVAEAAQLRDPDVERRLAAFEPRGDLAAGSSLLALGAATGRLALAGRDTAPDTRLLLVRTRCRPEIVEFHAFSSASPVRATLPFEATSSTVTRNRT